MADTKRTATIVGQSIALHITGHPDIPNRWGPGHIRVTGLRLDYGSLQTPDARRAIVTGLWVREDGEVTDQPLDRDYYAPTGDISAWPDWIADLARTHAPSLPPLRPASNTWTFEVCYDIAENKWHGCGPTYDNSVFDNAHETARDDFQHRAENDKQRRRFRMIRATTTYAVEAEYAPAVTLPSKEDDRG